jgi:entericidin B
MLTTMKHARLVVATALLAAMAALSACNTVEGVGEDVASTGRAVERAADDAKD